ncbi:hypothetical protein Dda_7748 [Drechslerella dactyloides]|uniref:Uncharacterized protein n=1 Tax=Drechslerella dactyloides TaxID=74499 RepID=A0AAD6ISR7_DREDA|nr:hypothetical protein Dda_7748 [Drechslerella dactyloides]
MARGQLFRTRSSPPSLAITTPRRHHHDVSPAMSADLAPELLRWLASVLAPKYRDVNRTYSDVATLLHHYRSLAPKTDVYTYDDGRSDLLLCVHGTIPVSFRGSTYNIPLNVWVPHQYPATPPTVMVVPGKSMGIRPTNHVDTNGRCYHPYLAYWSQNPDKSSLIDLCGQLKDVFSKEPPLYSKQQPPPTSAQQTPQAGPATPPPLPPLPQEIEAKRARAQATTSPRGSSQQQSADTPPPPPPPPPKAELQHPSPATYAYTTTPHLYLPQAQGAPQPIASPPTHSPPGNAQAPPDRPALPQKVPHEEPKPQPAPNAYQQQQQQPAPPPVPPIPSPMRNSTIGAPAIPPRFSGSPGPRHPHASTSPPPPAVLPPGPPQNAWPARSIQQQQHAHRLSGQYDAPINRFGIAQSTSPRPMSFAGYPSPGPGVPTAAGIAPLVPQSSKPPPPPPTAPPSQTAPPKPVPKPRFNLLDADDAGMIPASSAAATPAAVPPPLPPNPEKDRLINEIAKLLQQRAEAGAVKTQASLERTASQAEAMAKTETWMERERLELLRIQEVCEKDARILGERMGMADELIREVRDREAPNIDGVVVAPTVVHNQLYELVTDDMAIEDTIYVLGKALDKERITLDIFLKHTRALAREQFMKRALVKKISRKIGMS